MEADNEPEKAVIALWSADSQAERHVVDERLTTLSRAAEPVDREVTAEPY